MLFGHYAPAFLLQLLYPSVPLWVLLAGTQFVDICWAIFNLLEIESFRLVPGLPAVTDRSNAVMRLYTKVTLNIGRDELRMSIEMSHLITRVRTRRSRMQGELRQSRHWRAREQARGATLRWGGRSLAR